eukprot:567171-Heterocapsa_arctica.AAC.2
MHGSNKDNRKGNQFPGVHRGSKELQKLKQRWHNNVMNMEVKRKTNTQAQRPGTQPNSDMSGLHNWVFRLLEP